MDEKNFLQPQVPYRELGERKRVLDVTPSVKQGQYLDNYKQGDPEEKRRAYSLEDETEQREKRQLRQVMKPVEPYKLNPLQQNLYNPEEQP